MREHVGTNDIGYKRSKELMTRYKMLIQRMKAIGRCMVSGILPRLRAGQEWEVQKILHFWISRVNF